MAEHGGAIAVRNLLWAAALVRGLTEGGVRHAVLSPGSRSTPLALAFELCPHIAVQVLPDERCAAFMALGMSKASCAPAAVVCTSGTATANWFPAVVEASADRVPLVLISADRPPELQKTGANQVIDQARIFGGYVRDFVSLPAPGTEGPGPDYPCSIGLRATERARWPEPGPVHINAAFREPLVPAPSEAALEWPAAIHGSVSLPRLSPDDATVASLAKTLSGRPGVIVCGRDRYPDDFPQAICQLAKRLDVPIVADPLSGLRWGDSDRSHVLCAADLFLRSESFWTGHAPDWVLHFGAVPTSGPLTDFFGRAVGELILAGTGGDWADPSHGARRRILADPELLVRGLADVISAPAPGDWCAAWQDMEARAIGLTEQPDLRPVEADLVAAIEHSLPEDGLLFVGNSMVIRAFDVFASGRDRTVSAHGNRGASGIDGNISTLLGLATAGGRPVVGVIGDLALYHDMNGLLAGRDVDATIVVINNGGGGIFDVLPHREMPEFERLWLTPTGLDPERVAGLYGLHYERVSTGADLTTSLGSSIDRSGTNLIEFTVDREDSTRRFHALWQAATEL